MALQRISKGGARSLILILSDINMPGMSGLEGPEQDFPLLRRKTDRQKMSNGEARFGYLFNQFVDNRRKRPHCEGQD